MVSDDTNSYHYTCFRCRKCNQVDGVSDGIHRWRNLVIPKYMFEVKSFIRIWMKALPSWDLSEGMSN